MLAVVSSEVFNSLSNSYAHCELILISALMQQKNQEEDIKSEYQQGFYQNVLDHATICPAKFSFYGVIFDFSDLWRVDCSLLPLSQFD